MERVHIGEQQKLTSLRCFLAGVMVVLRLTGLDIGICWYNQENMGKDIYQTVRADFIRGRELNGEKGRL